MPLQFLSSNIEKELPMATTKNILYGKIFKIQVVFKQFWIA